MKSKKTFHSKPKSNSSKKETSNFEKFYKNSDKKELKEFSSKQLERLPLLGISKSIKTPKEKSMHPIIMQIRVVKIFD